MSLFTIGDAHLSFGVDKPMDIFRGWDDYVVRLEKNWNAVVGDGDTVVLPGDISWAMNFEDAKPDFKFIDSLNGKKIILKGNHDYWWGTLSKMNAFLSENDFNTISILHNNAFFVDGFSIAGTRGWFYDDAGENDKKVIMREAGRLRASLFEASKLGGELVAFLHYPPVSQSQSCDELVSVLLEFDVKKCFFGHLHGYVLPENASFSYKDISFKLVSADYLGFCPKLIT